mmetsp:Transcript_43246/g.52431  ORF Transcript_43246/g.52431 Transcript_43246/m.52431 type:complete len:136 (+) Transcript_43246:144-551(+)
MQHECTTSKNKVANLENLNKVIPELQANVEEVNAKCSTYNKKYLYCLDQIAVLEEEKRVLQHNTDAEVLTAQLAALEKENTIIPTLRTENESLAEKLSVLKESHKSALREFITLNDESNEYISTQQENIEKLSKS